MNLSSRQLRAFAVAAIALVVVLALSAALLAFQADAAVRRIADAMKPGYDITYVSPRVGFNGDLSVRELRVRPLGDGRATLTAERAVLRPPGPAWFLGAAFGSGAALPPIDRVSARLEGVAVEGGGDLHPALRWIGTRSAAPFEGAGCSPSIRLGGEDWEKLGLGSGTAAIDAEYAVTGPGLATLSAVFAVPGSSRVEHRRVVKVVDPLQPLPLDPTRTATVESQWAVVDDGFVTARNRFCARRARVARNQFADVHVAAVRDWLRRFDLDPGAELVESYRRYALGGGELRWQSRPRSPIVFSAYEAAPPQERLQALAATLAATGKAPVAFTFAQGPVAASAASLDPGALTADGDTVALAPPVDATVTTTPPMTADASTTLASSTPPSKAITPPPIPAAAVSVPPTTVPAAEPTAAPAVARIAQQPPSGEPMPSTSAPPAGSDTSNSADAPNIAVATPAPAPSPTERDNAVASTAAATAAPTPSPRAPMTVAPPSASAPPAAVASAPAPAAEPEAVAARPVAPPAKRPAVGPVRTGVVSYELLERAVNRRIAVRTVNDTRRLGVLRGWTGAALTLELSGRDGNMQLKIPKDEIVRAEVLDTAVVPPRAHAKKN